ncbi:MAG TPA: 1,4-dihydroxy-2-naphthoate polyprenyltransferase [Candidatus Omnitrophota bacterium]|nr:1,4-dihydroxy-2-naphthoate polyprenyltransferase [Candidatus Omnitrophota bacterium]HPD85415.1 1,4-dihydroxy-2-naphthoate polyprenyltransferase [Candidatus Omnitrophota bacterium]HRZ04084.1 1,4-dihydroxy-2-naphthoate polyprenyltransferase [Candidatus Omnitrophota bacterium]
MKLSSVKTWALAIRPDSLCAASMPVAIGIAMAYRDGVAHWPSGILAMIGAVLLQVGTNLTNDYCDYKNGVDKASRIGPARVDHPELITPKAMKNAIFIVFGMAFLVSIYLIMRGGWPILVIAVLSILCGALYTAGPRPLGYMGWGDVLVFLFFGPIATGGTYYVQSHTLNPLAMIAGCGPGLLTVGILVVNNLRDIEVDRKFRKHTLAVRFGRTFTMYEYFTVVVAGSLVPVVLYVLTQEYLFSLAAVLTCFFVVPAIKTVFSKTDELSLNAALAHTGKMVVLYSILFSIGWLL